MYSIYARTKGRLTMLSRTSSSSPQPNAPDADSKDMGAVKLCTNKILQFIAAGGG